MGSNEQCGAEASARPQHWGMVTSSMRAAVPFCLAIQLVCPARAIAQLGTASYFAAFGASAVTNTGATTLSGDLGVWPGSSITGSETIVLTGSIHQNDAVAQQAQADASTAYTNLFNMPCTTDLSGKVLGSVGYTSLVPGTYCFSSSAQLTGNLTLDFLGNPSSVFLFQVGSALTTASASSVTSIGGGPGSSVYWIVGSSATLGVATAFHGTIIANQSISLLSAATIQCGRAIALVGALTLDNNTISTECLGAGDGGGGVPTEVSPEPAAMSLFAVGLVAVGGWWRRKRLV